MPACLLDKSTIDEHYYFVGLISGTFHFRFKQAFQDRFVWMDITDEAVEVRT